MKLWSQYQDALKQEYDIAEWVICKDYIKVYKPEAVYKLYPTISLLV